MHFQGCHKPIFIMHGPASPLMLEEKLLKFSSGPHFLRGDLESEGT